VAGALAASLFAAAPAAASDYRYCRAGGEAASLVRTLKPDGRFALQTTLDGHIIARHRTGLHAYLVWPESPAKPPRLWITNSGYFEFMPAGTKLAFGAGGKDEDATLGHLRTRGDVDVFEADPEAVLRRFEGQRRVRLGFRGSDGRRLRTRVWFDLDALRAELAEAARLTPALDAGAGTCADTVAGLPKEADLNMYACLAADNDSATSLTLWMGRVSWQYRVSPNLYFEANVYGNEPVDEAAPGSLFQGRFVDFALRLTYTGAYRNRPGLTVELGAGKQAMSFPFGDNAPDWRRMREVLTWDRALALEAGGGAIPLVVRDASGAVVERAALPPALFSGAEQRVRALARREKAMMEDRFNQCDPPQDIVVT
jgi:hypothetical protein